MLDTIKGWKEIFKFFGVRRTLWYSINGSLEKRVKEHVWRKNEKPIIDLLTSVTLTSGVIKAINFLNGGVFGEALFSIKEKAKFLSQYFVDEEQTKESIGDLYKKIRVSISNIGPEVQFELYRKASKKLLKLIEAHSENPHTVQWLWTLSLHISRRYEELGIESSEKRERLENNPKILKEMKYIDSNLGKWISSSRFDASLREEIIRIQSNIGLRNSDYFVKLLIKLKDRRETEAAAHGYISAIAREKWTTQNYIKAICFLLMQASQQKSISVKIELINLIDSLIRRHTENYRAVSVKLLPTLNVYMIALGKEASKSDVVPEIVIPYLGKMFNYSGAMKILTDIMMFSDDARKKELAFNEAVIIATERLPIKGLLNIKLAKKGIDTKTLKSFGLYTPYKYAVQQMVKSMVDGSGLIKGSFDDFFSICPSVSLEELMANIKKLDTMFKRLDRKYKIQWAEIEANFKHILNDKIKLDDKIAIIENMKGKQYCGKKWSELKGKLDQLNKLKDQVKEKAH